MRILTTGAEIGDAGLTSAYLFITYGVEADWTMSRSSSVVRSGNYSWYWKNYQDYHLLYIDPTPNDEIYVRMGLRWASSGDFFTIGGSGGNYMGFDINGTDFRTFGPWGTLVDTESSTPVNTWYLIEIHLKTGVTGTLEVKKDGVMIYENTSINVGAGDISYLQFWTESNNVDHYMDDLAVNDTSGSSNNGWIGDGHVVILKANAAGDQTDLTPSSGNNWDCIDEEPISVSDYTSGSDTGDYDLYNVAPHGLSNAAINCVSPIGLGMADTDDGLACKVGIKTSGSEAWSDPIYLRTGRWDYLMGDNYGRKPDGSEWVLSDLDNIQIGFKIDDG